MGSQPQHRLFILDTDLSQPHPRNGRILSCLPDGSDLQTVIPNVTTLPDGITIDQINKHMYWTNMGPSFKVNNGSIERSNLDGSDRQTIIPPGSDVGVFTPKQITIAPKTRKLYWCDREGMKVMRSSLDGSNIEVLISTGSTDEDRLNSMKWCVGITVDEEHKFFYWTQKGPSKGGKGRIFRASTEFPANSTPDARPDVELLFSGLPEPIDLDIDEASQTLYWTDRGDPPEGNSLNRAFVGARTEGGEEGKGKKEVLAKRLHETIALAVDFQGGVAYVTDLSGGVYRIGLETREKRVLFAELGDITGIALASC
ncbi:uncharacterized protein BCR38DRAFT_488940 [Pseudomassariella vexata]|uniref:YWTD domain-containing protein n=1 Tax=Pseudomassariella vexata TaxID=1141098 RepID=A0A1Y2DKB9_9PEZI|nr:uncharacterized protein BCR38DRAFT_488940 [Pseudomassariella vexata]ORY59205.1 hypothetical protein BCR38DRAFT_488940 [Pseudomassariella vexata]